MPGAGSPATSRWRSSAPIRSIRDVGLLEELQATAAIAPPEARSRPSSAASLARGELLDANVSPELVLDVLLVRWPAAGRGAALAGNGR